MISHTATVTLQVGWSRFQVLRKVVLLQLNGRERFRRERMKRVMWVVFGGSVSVCGALQQETPAWEINGGYSYIEEQI